MAEMSALDPIRMGLIKTLTMGNVMLSRDEFLAFMEEWDYADRARRVLRDIADALESGDLVSAVRDALFMADLAPAAADDAGRA